MFGNDRAADVLAQPGDASSVIDRLLGALDGYTDPDAEQEDDITLVVLRREELRPARVLADFRVASAPGNERDAMRRVTEAVGRRAAAASALERLGTATAEATMNAMEHGNRYDPDLFVHVQVLATDDELTVSHRRPRRRPRDRAGAAARHRRQARRPPVAARLGPVPDSKHGRRAARGQRRLAPHGGARSCAWKEAAMTQTGLEAHARTEGDATVLELHGEIDGSARDALRAAYDAGRRRRAGDPRLRRASATSTRRGSR